MHAVAATARVVAWCKRRGITVVFTKHDPVGHYDYNRAMITINRRHSVHKKLHVLLHECGHCLIDRSGPVALLGDRDRRSFSYKCDVLEEEIEAWHRAWALAERLKLGLDRRKFDETKRQKLKLYVRWAAKKRRKKL